MDKVRDENRPSAAIAAAAAASVKQGAAKALGHRTVLGNVTNQQQFVQPKRPLRRQELAEKVVAPAVKPAEKAINISLGSDDTIEELSDEMETSRIQLGEEEDDEEDEGGFEPSAEHNTPDAAGRTLADSAHRITEHIPFFISETNPGALFPEHTESTKAQLELVRAKYDNAPGLFDEYDEDTHDISMVAEYSHEIFEYMRSLENLFKPDHCYMDRQADIKWSMRSVLVDWLVQVHHRFHLLPETLFLTINYIDRFLSVKTVSLTKFQLVGAVALLLAAKYEEINCPSVAEIAYMVDHGYTVDEIIRAERYMVDLLQFNLGWPGPMSFLRRISKADDYEQETRTLAKYLLEVTLMDERFVASPPSWVAAAAHCAARRMLERGPWTELHVYFSGYTEQQLERPIAAIIERCKDPHTNHRAIFEKYRDRRYRRASSYVNDWIRSNV